VRSTLAQGSRRGYDQVAYRFLACEISAMSDVSPLHRREFARQCLGGLGAASLAATGSANDAPPEEKKQEPESQRELPSPEMLTLTQLMMQYKSEHYTDENLQAIFGDIAADIARSRQLRAFPLANGDAPAAAFRVFRTATEGAE
jgi:hypothetical protein